MVLYRTMERETFLGFATGFRRSHSDNSETGRCGRHMFTFVVEELETSVWRESKRRRKLNIIVVGGTGRRKEGWSSQSGEGRRHLSHSKLKAFRIKLNLNCHPNLLRTITPNCQSKHAVVLLPLFLLKRHPFYYIIITTLRLRLCVKLKYSSCLST